MRAEDPCSEQYKASRRQRMSARYSPDACEMFCAKVILSNVQAVRELASRGVSLPLKGGWELFKPEPSANLGSLAREGDVALAAARAEFTEADVSSGDDE